MGLCKRASGRLVTRRPPVLIPLPPPLRLELECVVPFDQLFVMAVTQVNPVPPISHYPSPDILASEKVMAAARGDGQGEQERSMVGPGPGGGERKPQQRRKSQRRGIRPLNDSNRKVRNDVKSAHRWEPPSRSSPRSSFPVMGRLRIPSARNRCLPVKASNHISPPTIVGKVL